MSFIRVWYHSIPGQNEVEARQDYQTVVSSQNPINLWSWIMITRFLPVSKNLVANINIVSFAF